MSLDQPNIEPVADGVYRLEENYKYNFQDRGLFAAIIVYAGFLHDGASVPRLAYTVSGITPDGLIRAAALVHDLLYERKGVLKNGEYMMYNKTFKQWRAIKRVFTRKEADKLFYSIMLDSGMKKHKAWMAYTAVRLGGWTYWNKK